MKHLFFLTILFFSSHSIAQCVSGDCYNGKGKFNYDNGDTYYGDFVNGFRHGKGKYTWANGNTYDGDYVNESRTGKGFFVWGKGKWEGDTYDGDFVNGNRTGYGKYTFADGTVQEGYFENGKFLKSSDESTAMPDWKKKVFDVLDRLGEDENNSTSTQSIADSDYSTQFLEAHQRFLKAFEQKSFEAEIKEIMSLIGAHSPEISVDKDIWSLYKVIFEEMATSNTENNDLFSLTSYMYIKCQNKIDVSFNSHNQSIINNVINNYTADTYINASIYNELVRCKNEVNEQNQLIKESEESARLEKYTNFAKELMAFDINNPGKAPNGYEYVYEKVNCDGCNRTFEFKFRQNGKWYVVTKSRPGYIKHSYCDLGTHYHHENPIFDLKCVRETFTDKGIISEDCDGWEKCYYCDGTGIKKELQLKKKN